ARVLTRRTRARGHTLLRLRTDRLYTRPDWPDGELGPRKFFKKISTRRHPEADRITDCRESPKQIMTNGAQIQQRMKHLKMFFGQAVAVALAVAPLLIMAGGAKAATSDNLQDLATNHGSLTIGDK